MYIFRSAFGYIALKHFICIQKCFGVIYLKAHIVIIVSTHTWVRIWPVQYELIVTPYNSMYGDLHLDCNPTPSSSLLWSAPVQPTRETYSQHRVKMGPSPQSTQSSPGSRHHGSYKDHRPNCSCSSTGWGKHAKWRGRNEETTRKRG